MNPNIIHRAPVLLLLLCCLVGAGAADIKQVRDDVRAMNRAVYSGDVDTVLQFTLPSILNAMGGEAKARVVLEESLAPLASRMTVESLKFPAPPTFFSSTARDFVFVPTLTIIRVDASRAESLNFQVGVRDRNGGKWKYVEGSRVNHENVKTLFPDFPDGIEFPKFYRKKI